jgi:anti-sigma factor RsiW
MGTRLHPLDVDLEALRTGEADRHVERHVAHCPRCRTRVAELGALGARLRGASEALAMTRDGAAVRAAAREAAVRGRAVRRRRQLRRTVAASAAAGLAGMALWIGLEGPDASPSRRMADAAAHTVAPDVNGDGRVDVLDAFAVARVIEAGGAPEPGWDLDGDANVDRRDVELIARAAVALDEVL